MISAIRHIGRWSLKKQKKSALDALLHSLDPDRYGHILVVDVHPESGFSESIRVLRFLIDFLEKRDKIKV